MLVQFILEEPVMFTVQLQLTFNLVFLKPVYNIYLQLMQLNLSENYVLIIVTFETFIHKNLH